VEANDGNPGIELIESLFKLHLRRQSESMSQTDYELNNSLCTGFTEQVKGDSPVPVTSILELMKTVQFMTKGGDQ
jgi:hypothetical protein